MSWSPISKGFGHEMQLPPALVGGTPFTATGSASLQPTTIGVAPRHMQLTPETGGLDGRVGFNQTHGHAPQIVAEFDFQIADRGALDRADGMSVVLMDRHDAVAHPVLYRLTTCRCREVPPQRSPTSRTHFGSRI